MTQLYNPSGFWKILRDARLFGAALEQSEVDGTNHLLAAMGGAGWGPKFTAYGLATAFHETAGTMQPIRERGSDAYLRRMYDVQGDRRDMARQHGNTHPGDGARYCGRGYVQLTWRNNYIKAGEAVGVDLEGQPDKAMDPDIAARILVWGMGGGHFTGRKLADYITPNACDFFNARRIINSLDRAADVAGYARTFLSALNAGAWAA